MPSQALVPVSTRSAFAPLSVVIRAKCENAKGGTLFRATMLFPASSVGQAVKRSSEYASRVCPLHSEDGNELCSIESIPDTSGVVPM